MTDAPKLLTEAEVIRAADEGSIVRLLRERGLVAPEPDERVAGLVKYFAELGLTITDRQAEIAVEIVESRMELEREKRPVLTRDDCARALRAAGYYVGSCDAECLHTALQEQLK